MSCNIGELTSKPCNTVNAKGISKLLAIPIHAVESITFVEDAEGNPLSFSAITLKAGMTFFDVTASKRKASASFALDGEDPDSQAFSNTISLMTPYLTPTKLTNIRKFLGVEVLFIFKDNNKNVWIVGDTDKGLFKQTLEGGTGTEADGENGATLTFVGNSMKSIWVNYTGDFAVDILPKVFGYVAPPPPPVTP